MNYEELLEVIEGLPHTMKVPLRRSIRYAQKEHELLVLKDKHISHLQSLYASTISYDSKLISQWSAEVRKVQTDIWKLEKELEEMK